VQATNWFGQNQFTTVNGIISDFNQLTKAGGGSPFYCGGTGANSANPADPTYVAAGCTAGTVISNPYYNTALQSPMTINGWYPGAGTGINPGNPNQGYFDTPWNATVLLNYRKNKFAITPSLQLQEGTSYGGPLDTNGVDPRGCGYNSISAVENNPAFDPTKPVGPGNMPTTPVTPITALSPSTNPQQCEFSSYGGTQSNNGGGFLYIPNPVTGNFNTQGQYRNPWQLGLNVAMSYDVSSKVSLKFTVANLYRTCFGGSKEPWTSAYAAGKNVCGYIPAGPAGAYVSNFYNGTSPADAAANGIAAQPWQTQPYLPTGNGFVQPLNMYFTVNVKL